MNRRGFLTASTAAFGAACVSPAGFRPAAAKLPAIRFHDLRHTAATLLLVQGVDPRTIMETLGHSQISLTRNTYSHVLPALQADAAAKLDAILTR